MGFAAFFWMTDLAASYHCQREGDLRKKPEKMPDPRSVKVVGFFWILEAVVMAGIVLGRFVFGWF